MRQRERCSLAKRIWKDLINNSMSTAALQGLLEKTIWFHPLPASLLLHFRESPGRHQRPKNWAVLADSSQPIKHIESRAQLELQVALPSFFPWQCALNIMWQVKIQQDQPPLWLHLCTGKSCTSETDTVSLAADKGTEPLSNEWGANLDYRCREDFFLLTGPSFFSCPNKLQNKPAPCMGFHSVLFLSLSSHN